MRMKKRKYFGPFLLLAISIFSFSFVTGGNDKPDPDPMTYYYMGEIKAMSPDSVPYGTYVALTKQVVNKKEHTIAYQVLSIDQKGEMKEYNYTMKINDPTYEITDNDGNFKGSGKLHGKEWKWQNWNYTINYTNPVGKMVGKDFVSWWGLMVNKDFYGPDGKISIHYHERHNFITKEQFEILYLQVLKAGSHE
jgi:hypothetical protein